MFRRDDGGEDGEDATLGVGGAKTQRSNTVAVAHSPEMRAPKLPTRSRTSPIVDRGRVLDGEREKVRDGERRERVKKAKTCVKCNKMIEDGRWVQCDGGSVLCDSCWKSMYLPKCRRCNKPIERQAVSSSDGQLKGKYHRECFNCHKCHKPFPDKSFYVFEGKPLCAYHYHEANQSLCARCGQPIEGPCAVSHGGEKYHPEHFICEYAGNPRCGEKLVEYWEVDGRMLCERHAFGGSVYGARISSLERYGRREEEDMYGYGYEKKTAKATKRVTRFIDLANGGIEESGLR
ncbi:hypothetical protein AMATHDRAFT_141899 [Amanita thiersii Skay4041]|uniref:LIM zinc-binding domain-containing protein n=1 Tax=Amanita thiersii Skay4041 TaxID=703135 RepID=A0A2A9NTZ5_9AGAR|nr:hypothetical protein AMATHDRAFT_141899 [Amanita thiersii Skay4041]